MGLRERLLSPPGRNLLLALLAVDILLIGFSALHVFVDSFAGERFSIQTERGYGEIFQYIKFLAAAALLGFFATRCSPPFYAVWSFVFGYLAVDDAFQFHERLGAALVDRLGLAQTVRGVGTASMGDVAAMAAIGIVIGAVVLWGYFQGGPRDRAIGRRLLVPVVLLGCAAVLMDAVRSLVHRLWMSRAVIILEDGGEMAAASLALAYVAALWLSGESGHLARGVLTRTLHV